MVKSNKDQMDIWNKKISILADRIKGFAGIK